jgi:hypothetical protein
MYAAELKHGTAKVISFISTDPPFIHYYSLYYKTARSCNPNQIMQFSQGARLQSME